MSRIHITRTVQVPDPVRIGRYQKAPELGPRILFFSGGSALNGTSRALKRYTHNSIHLVTPFDSGGSSAKLRQAFQMPAIGDLRSRLMALADETVTGHPEVFRLFTHRLPKDTGAAALLRRLDTMVAGKDRLVAAISDPMRRLIRIQLSVFRDAMPAGFDLRGASIGNLILGGGYLNNQRHLDPIIFLFSKLVGVRGTVRAVVNDNLHLGADLRDGRRLIGQHRLTGKEVAPLGSPIERLFLCADIDTYVPAEAQIVPNNRQFIDEAELICFPFGSFYSSLVANLLPRGVTSAIAGNEVPKVYIPNLGRDPEQLGMTLDDAVTTLLDYLRADIPADCPDERLVNFVLLDNTRGSYPSRPSRDLMRRLGIQVIDTQLVSSRSAPYYDPGLLVAALLSLT